MGADLSAIQSVPDKPYKFRLFRGLESLPGRTYIPFDETCPVLSRRTGGIYGGNQGPRMGVELPVRRPAANKPYRFRWFEDYNADAAPRESGESV